jgi:hypothetical protein
MFEKVDASIGEWNMTIPGFTAEVSLSARRSYRGLGRIAEAHVDSIVPAIPYCGNCDYILEWCARTHNSHSAICIACATGNCYGPPTTPPPLGNGYYN